MKIVVTEVFLVDFQFLRSRLGVGICGLRRLAHDFAKLAGQNQVAFALHPQRFDKKHVAADGGPGQSGGDADLILLEYFLGNDFRRAQKLMQVFQRNANRAFVAFGDAPRDLATDSSDLSLQLPQPGFLRVLLNDRGQRGLGNMQILRA